MAWFTYRIGAIFRETGIALDRLGCQLQGKGSYAEERALLSLRIAPSPRPRPNPPLEPQHSAAFYTRPHALTAVHATQYRGIRVSSRCSAVNRTSPAALLSPPAPQSLAM